MGKETKIIKICIIGFDCVRYPNRSEKECKGCGWWQKREITIKNKSNKPTNALNDRR